MAFTAEEENIVKLMINELRTRKKLDAARTLRDLDLRAGIGGVQTQVDETYSATLNILQADFDAAENDIKNEFA
jgi:hypothetical protein